MTIVVASAVIAGASEIAQDVGNTTFTAAQGLAWLNEGILTICLVKPNAAVAIASKKLVPGTKQFCDGRELCDVIRNMGQDGNTPGMAILPFDRNEKDQANPNWHTATPATFVREYCWDIRQPRTYYVSPPVHPTTPVYVETMEAIDPAPITDPSQVIPVDDIFQSVLIDWILWRWFSRDSEDTPNVARAQQHQQAFYNAVRGQAQGEAQSSPAVKQAAEEAAPQVQGQ